MKTLTIHTLSGEEAKYNTSEKRLGVMVVGRETLFTIEKPFKPNVLAPDGVGGGVPFESSVPLGEYDMVLRHSPSKGVQWHFYNPALHVYLEKDDREYNWERFSTMFHIANHVDNVVGCCGPGLSLHNFGGTKGLGVGQSGKALKHLKAYLEGESKARLRIVL
jgi:hypothetical protein